MIVFTLDALANDSHRRHLIDPYWPPFAKYKSSENCRCGPPDCNCGGFINEKGEKWQPNYPAYYEACKGDAPIHPTMGSLKMISHCAAPIQIWSTLPESQRDKIYFWFDDLCVYINRMELRLRPIGDDRPQEELFEEWLIALPSNLITGYVEGKNALDEKIDMVFSSHGPTIAMLRKRGVFVFDCNQKL